MNAKLAPETEVPTVILNLTSPWEEPSKDIRPAVEVSTQARKFMIPGLSESGSDSLAATSGLAATSPLERVAAPLLDNSKQAITDHYTRLLRHERDQRKLSESKFAEEQGALQKAQMEHRERAKAFEKEKGRLLQKIEQKNQLLEFEKAVLLSKFEQERNAALGCQEKLKDRLNQHRLCERSLLKEVSALLLEREALKKQIRRSNSCTLESQSRSDAEQNSVADSSCVEAEVTSEEEGQPEAHIEGTRRPAGAAKGKDNNSAQVKTLKAKLNYQIQRRRSTERNLSRYASAYVKLSRQLEDKDCSSPQQGSWGTSDSASLASSSGRNSSQQGLRESTSDQALTLSRHSGSPEQNGTLWRASERVNQAYLRHIETYARRLNREKKKR